MIAQSDREGKMDEKAFPIPIAYDHGLRRKIASDFQGMTLRDYFAAKALPGFIVADEIVREGLKTNASTADDFAKAAYEQADAMMKARAAR